MKHALGCILILVFAAYAHAQQWLKPEDRLMAFPTEKQTAPVGWRAINTRKHTFPATYQSVWSAAQFAGSELARIGKRPVSTDPDRGRISNSNIDDAKKPSTLIKTDWVDEIIMEVTQITEKSTQVMIRRRVLELKTDARGKTVWADGVSTSEIAKWLLTLIEDELKKAVPNRSGASLGPTPQSSPKTLKEVLDALSQDISNKLVSKIVGKNRITVEIADFEPPSTGQRAFGRYVAEELASRFLERDNFSVVDESTRKRTGRPAMVDGIVQGTITDNGNSIRIYVRIQGQTGALAATAVATIAKGPEICDLLGCRQEASAVLASVLDKKNSNFFSFELQKCQLSGTSVICEFLISNYDSNTETPRRLRMFPYSTSMFDDFSSQIRAKDIKLGNQDSDALLVSNAKATPARIEFQGVSSKATKITLLEIVCSNGNTRFSVKFSNIPIR